MIDSTNSGDKVANQLDNDGPVADRHFVGLESERELRSGRRRAKDSLVEVH